MAECIRNSFYSQRALRYRRACFKRGKKPRVKITWREGIIEACKLFTKTLYMYAAKIKYLDVYLIMYLAMMSQWGVAYKTHGSPHRITT